MSTSQFMSVFRFGKASTACRACPDGTPLSFCVQFFFFIYSFINTYSTNAPPYNLNIFLLTNCATKPCGTLLFSKEKLYFVSQYYILCGIVISRAVIFNAEQKTVWLLPQQGIHCHPHCVYDLLSCL